MLRPFAHPVACCWMLLRVVAQSLKPVKLFSQQLPTFLLFRDRRSVAQQCWIRLHNSSNIVALGPRTLITHGLQRLMGCILPTTHCRSHTTTNTHPTTPNIVGSCCVRLHAALPATKGLFPFHRFKVRYTRFSPFQWILKNYLYENKNVRSINQVFLERKAPSEPLLKLEA